MKLREEWTLMPDERWVASTHAGGTYRKACTNRCGWDGKVFLADEIIPELWQ